MFDDWQSRAHDDNPSFDPTWAAGPTEPMKKRTVAAAAIAFGLAAGCGSEEDGDDNQGTPVIVVEACELVDGTPTNCRTPVPVPTRRPF
jgi:hypothetical protein